MAISAVAAVTSIQITLSEAALDAAVSLSHRHRSAFFWYMEVLQNERIRVQLEMPYLQIGHNRSCC